MKKLYLVIVLPLALLSGSVYGQENTYNKTNADTVKSSEQTGAGSTQGDRPEYLVERDNEHLQLLKQEARKASEEAREAKRIERKERAEAKEAKRALKAEQKAQKARKKADRLSRKAITD
jgi:hypothetical protein